MRYVCLLTRYRVRSVECRSTYFIMIYFYPETRITIVNNRRVSWCAKRKRKKERKQYFNPSRSEIIFAFNTVRRLHRRSIYNKRKFYHDLTNRALLIVSTRSTFSILPYVSRHACRP